MPKMTHPRELFLHELREVLGAEELIAKMLPQLRKEAGRDKELSRALQKHETTTRQHVKRVQDVFKALKEPARAEKPAGLEGLQAQHDRFVREAPAPEILATFVSSAAARTEHYEIAAYTGLVASARALGEKRAVQLLEQNLKEDKAMLGETEKIARRLTREGAKTAKDAEKQAQTEGGRSAPNTRRATSRARSRSGTTGRSRSGTSGRGRNRTSGGRGSR